MYEVLNLSKTACRFLSTNHVTCQTEIGSYVHGTWLEQDNLQVLK